MEERVNAPMLEVSGWNRIRETIKALEAAHFDRMSLVVDWGTDRDYGRFICGCGFTCQTIDELRAHADGDRCWVFKGAGRV